MGVKIVRLTIKSEGLASLLNLPSIVYPRERADVLQIYRIIHGIDHIDCNMFFELALEEGTIARGHSLKIKKV